MSDMWYLDGLIDAFDIAIEILSDARNEFPNDFEKQRSYAFNEMWHEREKFKKIKEKKEERESK